MTQENKIDTPAELELRQQMIINQLKNRGINEEPVLKAFRAVSRWAFCPESTSLEEAYADHPLGINCGQTISQPYMVARMTLKLKLRGDEKVLEIGTGSGYQAAILAQMAAEVHTVETYPELAEGARNNLDKVGIDNVEVHTGDGTMGWDKAAPFDAIIVTAAAPEVPEPLIKQLAEKGRLVAPGGDPVMQHLIVGIKQKGQFKKEKGEGCVFVPLIGEYGWRQ